MYLFNFNTSYFTEAKSAKYEFLKVLSSINNNMWYELGGFFGIDTSILDGLLNCPYFDGVKMSKVLESWLDNEPTPAT